MGRWNGGLWRVSTGVGQAFHSTFTSEYEVMDTPVDNVRIYLKF
jgi:hypothetical protein